MTKHHLHHALTTVFMLAAAAFGGTNELQTGGFEVQGSGPDYARNWQFNNPDTHGDYWGSAARRNWRAHSAFWEMAIQGSWSGKDYGGIWQEIAATQGVMYEASAWFWADTGTFSGGAWTAAVQDLKIEFYAADYTPLDNFRLAFTNQVVESWTQKLLRAMAPPGVAWARFVIGVDKASAYGALQVDDAVLRKVTSRDQNFNDWSTQLNDGSYTQDDWVVSTGKSVTAQARSGRAISLPPPGGITNYIRSPSFEDGIGTISFWYRHSSTDTNEESLAPIRFAVAISPDGATWSTIGTLTNVINVSYRRYSVFTYQSTPYYVRIQHTGGSTNRLLVDDVLVDEPSALSRSQDFDAWSGTSATCQTEFDWLVCTGIVEAVTNRSGKSAYLLADSNSAHYVRTPYFSNGYGTVRFNYARGTNGAGAANLWIEESPDTTNWTVLAGVSNITTTSFLPFERFFYQPLGRYLRVRNAFISDATNRTLISEPFDSAPTPPPGWTYSGTLGSYGSALNSGAAIPSLQFGASNATIQLPGLTSPTNLRFWVKGVSTSTNLNIFAVEYTATTNSTWAAVVNISPLPTASSNALYSMPLQTTVTNLRFRYAYKIAGNVAFDDLLVEGLPPAPAAQSLFLDDIEVDYAELVRNMDFESWPKEDSYGTYTYKGWTANGAIIDSDVAYDSGQGLKFESSPSSGQYLQSPTFPDGIGPISFWYRSDQTTTPATCIYEVQISTNNGVSWYTNASVNVPSNAGWTAYSAFLAISNPAALRLYHLNGGRRVAFDNVSVSVLQPPANLLMNGYNLPTAPYTNDSVQLVCDVIPIYNAYATNVVAYYRVGTTGAFTAVSMVLTNGLTYYATSNIAPRAPGTHVQYFFRANFAGPGSSLTSPAFYPIAGSNAPAEYIVPRSHPGQVWINEINYVNNAFDGPTADMWEFIELCAPSGFDLAGWRVDLYEAGFDPQNPYYLYSSYTLPTNARPTNTVSGYGFYLLGDSSVAPQRLLTNFSLEGPESNIQDVYGAVRLLNESGGTEQEVSYGADFPYFDFFDAAEDSFSTNPPDPSLQLVGFGTNESSLTWFTNSMSPGTVNVGQQFTDQSLIGPPNAYVDRMSVSTNVTMLVYGNSNNWFAAPYYATNLVGIQSWLPVTPFNLLWSSGTNTVTFPVPDSAKSHSYRMLFTKP